MTTPAAPEHPAYDPATVQKAVTAIEALDADVLPRLLRTNAGLASVKLADGRTLLHLVVSQPCAVGSRAGDLATSSPR